MLETIREYALEQLAESGMSRIIQRQHIAYFLALAERAEPELLGPKQQAWIEQLEREQDNLRAAISRALALQDVEQAGRLTAALGRFWYTHGEFSEGYRWLQLALAQERPLAAPVRAKALNDLGVLAFIQGDFAQAIARHEESLMLRRDLGDKRGISASLNNLGLVAVWQGDYARAATQLEEALRLSRELADERSIALSLRSLGEVARIQGDYDQAAALIHESLTLLREEGDTYSVAQALTHLGIVASYQGDYAQAGTLLEEGLSVQRAIGDKSSAAFSLLSLSEVARHQGDETQATALLAESLSLRWELGEKVGIAECLESFAQIAIVQAQFERAVRLFGAAAALRDAINAPLPPIDRAAQERAIATIRSRVDLMDIEMRWAEGRALTLEQAIADALEAR